MTITVRFGAAGSFLKGESGPPLGLKIGVIARGATDTAVIGAGPAKERFFLVATEPRLVLNGVPITDIQPVNGPRFADEPQSVSHREITLRAGLSTELLESIEAGRTDDVSANFACTMHFWCPVEEHGSPFQSAYPTLNQKVSAKDWLAILHEMGAGGGWTLELPRPGVEGLEESVAFLQSSAAKLEAHDPVGAMSDLRKAWDRAVLQSCQGRWHNASGRSGRQGNPRDHMPEGRLSRDVPRLLERADPVVPCVSPPVPPVAPAVLAAHPSFYCRTLRLIGPIDEN
jgi:hypothetical protein